MEAQRKIRFGYIALGLAALALIVSAIHSAAGPFAVQEPIEKTIADTAVAIKDATIRALSGAEAEPAPAPSRWNIDKIIQTGALMIAGAAMVFALVSFVQNEPKRPAIAGFTLAAGVLTMAWVQSLVLIIAGAIILGAIILFAGDLLSL